MRRRPDPRSERERFDRWAGRYENTFLWRHFFTPLHEMLAGRAGSLKGMSLLDVGCGTGGLLRRLSSTGAERLAGVDFSTGMLEVARALAGDSEIEFIRSSAETLPFPDGSFDIVTSCIAFHHFPDAPGTIREAARVLKPGGRLLICDPGGEGLLSKIMLLYGAAAGTDTRYFDRETMRRMAHAAGLEVAGAEMVMRFPPVMLVTAVKPGRQ